MPQTLLFSFTDDSWLLIWVKSEHIKCIISHTLKSGQQFSPKMLCNWIKNMNLLVQVRINKMRSRNENICKPETNIVCSILLSINPESMTMQCGVPWHRLRARPCQLAGIRTYSKWPKPSLGKVNLKWLIEFILIWLMSQLLTHRGRGLSPALQLATRGRLRCWGFTFREGTFYWSLKCSNKSNEDTSFLLPSQQGNATWTNYSLSYFHIFNWHCCLFFYGLYFWHFTSSLQTKRERKKRIKVLHDYKLLLLQKQHSWGVFLGYIAAF